MRKYRGAMPLEQFEQRRAKAVPLDEFLSGGRPSTESEDGYGAGDFGMDVAASFGQGANALLGAGGTLWGLATGHTDNWAVQQAERGREWWGELKSDELNAAEATRKAAIDAKEGEIAKAGVALWETLSNPLLLTSFVGEQIPMLTPVGAAGRGAAVASRALGAGAKTAGRVGTGTAIGAGAGLQGADAAGQAREQLERIPDALWAENPAIKALVAEGVDFEEARERVTQDLAQDTFLSSAAISVATNLIPGALAVERALTGVKVGQGTRLFNAAKGAFGEAAQEAAEEGSGAYLANRATAQVDPEQDPWAGVGEAAGLGATAGIFGLAAGATEKGSPGERQARRRARVDTKKVQDTVQRIGEAQTVDEAIAAGTASVADAANLGIVEQRRAQARATLLAEQQGVAPDAALTEELGTEPGLTPEEIDRRANEAATSPLNDRPEPSEAQKEAGNYKKGDRFRLHGLDIVVENPKGSVRSKQDEEGNVLYENVMAAHYGDIKRTEAADGDNLDVFVGPNPAAATAYVIDQIDQQTGAFDEHKSFVGFDTEAEARQAYLDSYDTDWQVGPVTALPVEEFRTWAQEGDLTRPLSPELEAPRGIPDADTAEVAETPQESRPAYADPRLKREGYRNTLNVLSSNLVKGGGGMGALIEREPRRGPIEVVGRVSSANPEWFQRMQDIPELRMTVEDTQKAIDKAVAGEKLGVRQQRVVQALLDDITAGRTTGEDFEAGRPPPAVSPVDEARAELARQREARREARVATGQPVPPPRVHDALADFYERVGEAFEEGAYPADWDFETRALFDMAEELQVQGVDPEPLLAKATRTRDDTPSTLDAFEAALERAYGTEATDTGADTGAEGAPAAPAQPAEEVPAEAPLELEPTPAPTEPAPAETAPGTSTDLFGAAPVTAQAIEDRLRAQAERRDSGQTDLTGTLFGADRAQVDIEDVATTDQTPEEKPFQAEAEVNAEAEQAAEAESLRTAPLSKREGAAATHEQPWVEPTLELNPGYIPVYSDRELVVLFNADRLGGTDITDPDAYRVVLRGDRRAYRPDHFDPTSEANREDQRTARNARLGLRPPARSRLKNLVGRLREQPQSFWGDADQQALADRQQARRARRQAERQTPEGQAREQAAEQRRRSTTRLDQTEIPTAARAVADPEIAEARGTELHDEQYARLKNDQNPMAGEIAETQRAAFLEGVDAWNFEESYDEQHYDPAALPEAELWHLQHFYRLGYEQAMRGELEGGRAPALSAEETPAGTAEASEPAAEPIPEPAPQPAPEGPPGPGARGRLSSAVKRAAADYGESNKVFTKDRADAALDLLKARSRDLNVGLDPQLMTALFERIGYHVEAGARAFGEVVDALVEEVGAWVVPYLPGAYNNVRQYPGFDNAGMSSAEEVDAWVQENEADVPGTGERVERDRGAGAAGEPVGADAVPAAGARDQQVPGGAGTAPVERRLPGEPDHRLPAADTAAARDARHNELLDPDGQVRSTVGPAGTAGRERGAGAREAGIPAEPAGADAAAQVSRQSALDRQRAADRAHPRVGSLADVAEIAQQVPALLREQAEDVAKAEQRLLIDTATGVESGFMVTNGTGTGKAQPLDAIVMTPAGPRRMGDLAVGELVLSGDGLPTVITDVFPQGSKPIYRVTFDDGASTECCDEHLWLTQTLYERRKARTNPDWNCARPKVRVLADIRQSLDKQHFVPVAPAAEMGGTYEGPVSPYILGVLLGDGTFRGAGLTFTLPDEPIVDRVAAELPADVSISREAYEARCQTIRLSVEQKRSVNGSIEPSWLIDWFRQIGLWGLYSHEKFIPAGYLHACRADREALLQGLLDTDGTVDRKSRSPIYCTTSGRLKDDVVWLVRSLGGIARVRRKENDHKGAWFVNINLPADVEPFHLDRKAALYEPNTKYPPRRKIVAVDLVGEKPAQCIRVDHPSSLYLTDDFIVTHNTFSGLGVIKRFVKRTGRQNVLVVTPTDAVNQAWSQAARDFFDLDMRSLTDTKDAGEGLAVTTYANFYQNAALYEREWDLVLYDESHHLLENMAGERTATASKHFYLTLHPDHLHARALDELGPELDAFKAWAASQYETQGLTGRERRWSNLPPAVEAEAERRWRALDERAKARVAELLEQPRPKVMFLSATPFAYHKTLDYANTYLFDFEEGNRDERGQVRDQSRGYSYNSGDGRERFMMEHLGYRMRTNKLTAPEAEVDQALMERRLNEWLIDRGALSRRMLSIDQDYSREFVEYESETGQAIDDGMRAIKGWRVGADGHYESLPDDEKVIGDLGRLFFEAKWDYHYLNALLEGLNTRQAIERARAHLALGRQVVVFHRYKTRKPSHPFRIETPHDRDLVHKIARRLSVDRDTAADVIPLEDVIRAQVAELERTAPHLYHLDLSALENPIQAFREAFPGRVGFINGDVSKRERRAAIADFQNDAGALDVQVVQYQAGKEGVSLHDLSGVSQRALLSVGLPVQATDTIQMEGRIYRVGNQSNAVFEYFKTGLAFEEHAFARTVASRSSTAENLAMGNDARDLMTAFVDGYNTPSTAAPGSAQGVGGKERDRRRTDDDPFTQAKSFYWANQKKTSRTKAAEDIDYFATPEPVGQKMVEWLTLEPNEKALEPSAGHGAIARWFPDHTRNVFVEASGDLEGKLMLNARNGRVRMERFEDLPLQNKFHGIAMNPPFGRGGATAVVHLQKAARHLYEGGRIVAIYPKGPAADKAFEKWFYDNPDTANLHLRMDLGLPSVTFERAGTTVAARILVIDKISSEQAFDSMVRTRDLTDAESIGALFDRIEHLSAVPRVRPELDEAARDPQERDQTSTSKVVPPATGGDLVRAKTQQNTRTGTDMLMAIPVEYLGDRWSAINQRAKALGGYWSRFKKKVEDIEAGWAFPDEAARDAFLAEMNVTDQAALQVSPIGFYSALSRAAENLKQAKGTPRQMLASLRKQGGVKEEEIQWTGLEEWLNARAEEGGPVSRQEIVDFLNNNGVTVEEVVLGDEQALVDDVGIAEEGTYDDDLDDGTIWYDVTLNGAASDRWKVREQTADPPGTRFPRTFRFELWRVDDGSGEPVSYGESLDDIQQNAAQVISELEAQGDPQGAMAPRYEEYTLPGGENYREVLLHMPPPVPQVDRERFEVERLPRANGDIAEVYYREDNGSRSLVKRGIATGLTDEQVLDSALKMLHPESRFVGGERRALYSGGHYGENVPNVLAHFRLKDRTGPNGERILFIEEVQSDWHQRGRKEGYIASAGETERRRAEYVAAQDRATALWPNVRDTLERMDRLGFSNVPEARYAVLEHEDWATRWDTTDLAPSAKLEIEEWRTRELEATRLGRQITGTLAQVPDAPFKGNAWAELVMKRAIRMAAEGGYDAIGWTTGEQQRDRYKLEGGRGMMGFYDTTLPNLMKKAARKLDKQARPGQIKIAGESGPGDRWWVRAAGGGRWAVGTWGGPNIQSFETQAEAQQRADELNEPHPDDAIPVHSLPITDQIKRIAVDEGQALFAHSAPAKPAPARPRAAYAGMTAAGVERAVRPLYDRIREDLGLQVEVVHSNLVETPLLEALEPGQRLPGFIRGRTVYLLHDQLESAQEAVVTFVHEVVGHMGVNSVLAADGRWDTVLKGYRAMKAAGGKRFDAIHQDLVRRYGELDEVNEVKEFIALAAEARTREGSVGRFMRQVREALTRWLSKIGVKFPFSMTDIDRILSASETFLTIGTGAAVAEDVAYAALQDDFTPAEVAVIEKVGGVSRPRSKRFRDRLAEINNNRKTRFRQYWIDSYASIREILGDSQAWMKAHLTASSSGAMEAAIDYGQLYLHADGVLQVNTSKRSLKEILAPLGADIDRFLLWVAGNRAAKLAAEGRENLMDLNDIATLRAMNQDGTPGDPGYRDGRAALFDEVRDKFEEFSDSIVEIAVQTGLIDQAEADVWRIEGFYLPFYRVLAEGETQGPRAMANPGLVRQQAYKRLKGGTQKLDDLLGNALLNWNHLVAASLKNRAAREAIETATQMTDSNGDPLAQQVAKQAASKQAVYVRVDGKPVYYEFSPTPEGQLVLQALAALNWEGFQGRFMKAARAMKRAFTIGVTASPEFKVANLLRDSIQAIAVARISTNVAGNLFTGWKASRQGSDAQIQALASGAIFAESGYIHGADPDAIRYLLTRGIRRDTILDTRWRVKRVWDAYQDFGARLENVNRMADVVGQDPNVDKLTAAFGARDHLDFTRHGAGQIARFLTQTVGFLNARIQGLDKLSRSAVDEQQKGQFRTVVGVYSALAVGLYLLMAGDDDYEAAEQWERDAYHLFKLPGSDVMYRIPRPFEVGAIANMAERAVEQFWSKDAHGSLFAERLWHTLVHTFSFNPAPQIVFPALEVWGNKNTFTDRPIESWGMARLSPEERKRAWTSETAIAMSRGMAGTLDWMPGDWTEVTLSPVQIEHLVQGYLGWMGATGLAGTDMLLTRPVTGAAVPPERRLTEYPVIKRFARTGPPRNTKQTTEFYEALEEVNRIYADIGQYRRLRDLEGARALQDANREKLRFRRFLGRRADNLSDINNRMTLIRLDADLPASAKRREMDRLQTEKNRMTRATMEALTEAGAN